MVSRLVDTTVGRMIFNRPIPQDLGFVDRSDPENRFKLEIDFLVGKKQLGKIIDKCIKVHGLPKTSEVLDAIKAQGYKYSTKSAITVAVCDATIPPQKKEIIAEAEKKIDLVTDQFKNGLLSDSERYNAGTEDLGKGDQRRYRRPAEGPGPLQPDFHDGGFRRPWFHEPDPSARGHARPDCKYLR